MKHGSDRRLFLISAAGLIAARALPARANDVIQGKPTNLDEHGDRPMGGDQPRASNVDSATAHDGNAPRAIDALQPVRPSAALIPVLTRSHDNLRTGANLQESVLKPSNLGGLKKLFSMVISDDARGCEAQPLLIPNVRLAAGTTHDVCILCSMANTVWAYDANDGTLLWVQRLGNPIPDSTDIDGWKINDHWGILSTPVIDPDTKILYCVTWSDPAGNWRTAVHTFHALNLADGTHAKAPIDLSGITFNPGHGLPAQAFKTSERKQRAGLLLANVKGRKTVFVAFGTIQETSANARGWLVAVDVVSNSVGAAWCTTSRYSGGGVWMAGQGPAADANGNVYVLTGNGSFDGVTEFGECILKLEYTPPAAGAAGKIVPVDWFSPFSDSGRAGGPQAGDHITVDNGGGWDDMDLGSGGIVVIPSKGMVGAAGKDGIWYSLDYTKMGKTVPADFSYAATNYSKAKWIGWFTYYNPATPTPPDFSALNQFYANRTHHQHSTPVLFESANHGTMLFCGGENGNVRAWTVNANGSLTYLGCSAQMASPQSPVPHGGMPGFMMSLSANGSQDGILWATCPSGDANRGITQGFLYAFDASNLGTYSDGSGALNLLWTSPQYTYNKFNPPVISGGKVYLPTYDGHVDVYGI